jgi:uncharacterized protein GlcG (DUF336 family)
MRWRACREPGPRNPPNRRQIGEDIMRIELLVGAALAALATMPVSAQSVINTHRLSHSLANEAVAEAVGACAKQGYHVTAVLLDDSGKHQAILRGDGADIHTLDSAEMKAYTAVSFRTDTIDIVERAKKGEPPSAIAKDPKMILAQGGVVIKVGSEVVGAIGVGGGPGNNIDTNCARAGLAKIADRLK